MRSTTLLWLALAVICGGVLFHTSQQVTDGRTRLAVLDEDIRKENETIRVLQAEWSYLNQPDRLEKLSKQYLNLAPLGGRQFTKVTDLADRTVEAPAPAATAQPTDTTAAASPKTPEIAGPKAPVVAAVPPIAKPASPAKPAVVAQAPVVKLRPPLPAPAAQKHAKPETAQRNSRQFSDLMKSLGVH